jgi:hypothetical protein
MKTKHGLVLPGDPYSYGRGSMYQGRFYPFALMGGAAAAGEGYHDSRDIVTSDGVAIREIVAEFDDALAVISERRDTVMQRLVFETTEAAVKYRRAPSEILFEQGSEYGTPGFQRTAYTTFSTGLPIKSYKVGTGWTIEYLAAANAAELRAQLQDYTMADMNLQWQLALQTLLNDLAGATYTFPDLTLGDLIVRAPLYNGDGTAPPTFEGVTFPTTHDHYMVSGGVTLTQANVTVMSKDLDSHGHRDNKILFVHEDQVDDVLAMADFVAPPDPNVADPAEVFSRVGSPYLGVIRGLNVRVRQWNLLPTGYAFMFNDYGAGSANNPVARREFPQGHPLRGLRLYRPDPNTIYPVEQTFYQRWVGFGSNMRSNGIIMQVTAGAYAVPSILTLRQS